MSTLDVLFSFKGRIDRLTFWLRGFVLPYAVAVAVLVLYAVFVRFQPYRYLATLGDGYFEWLLALVSFSVLSLHAPSDVGMDSSRSLGEAVP